MKFSSPESAADQLDLGLTHVAINVSDIEASIRFYERYADLKDIHRRGSGSSRVAWISDLKRPFGLVLIQRRGGPLRRWIAHQLARFRPALAHVGVALNSREEVDALCEQARREGILSQATRDAGHPVNYYGMVADPDGNKLELSYGQVVSRAFVDASQREG